MVRYGNKIRSIIRNNSAFTIRATTDWAVHVSAESHFLVAQWRCTNRLWHCPNPQIIKSLSDNKFHYSKSMFFMFVSKLLCTWCLCHTHTGKHTNNTTNPHAWAQTHPSTSLQVQFYLHQCVTHTDTHTHTQHLILHIRECVGGGFPIGLHVETVM